MPHASLLRPAPLPDDVSLVHVADPAPSFWRYLYSEVGREYRWTDRLGWSDEEIAAYLADPAIDLWVLKAGETIAGYFELRRHPDAAIEIAYFGLLPDFVGRGLGKGLLSAAVTEAWRAGAARVWLHTSSLDHRAALPNYLGRGFTIFKRETYEVT
jgi:ribosomal protein S18 acetylase RimI-like enzyme